jgi:hypothetical protein
MEVSLRTNGTHCANLRRSPHRRTQRRTPSKPTFPALLGTTLAFFPEKKKKKRLGWRKEKNGTKKRKDLTKLARRIYV